MEGSRTVPCVGMKGLKGSNVMIFVHYNDLFIVYELKFLKNRFEVIFAILSQSKPIFY